MVMDSRRRPAPAPHRLFARRGFAGGAGGRAAAPSRAGGLNRTMEGIRIVPTGEEHVEGFNAAVGVVARERRYIGFVDGMPLEASREFVHATHAGGGVHLVAVADDGEVVGWG